MDPQVFFQVVLPLYGIDRFTLIGISTPDDEHNYYSKLLELRTKNDEPLFLTMRISQACKDCIAKDRAAKCKHMQYLLPAWKSGERQENLELILSSDPLLHERENLGIVRGGETYCFERADIEKFKKRPRYTFARPPGVVYFSVDPSGGGDYTHFAVTLKAYEGGQEVVSSLVY